MAAVSSKMSFNVLNIDASEDLPRAAQRLTQEAEEIGLLGVERDGRLIGIVTPYAIVLAVGNAKWHLDRGHNLAEMPVTEVAMTRFEWVRPEDDLEKAKQVMEEHNLDRMPVVRVDENTRTQRLVGTISYKDI